MKEWTLIPPESGAIVIEGCSIFNHPRIRGRYRSSHLCRLSPALYPLLCRLMSADPLTLRRCSASVERQVTPWNASGITSPRFGHLSQFGTSKARVTSRSRHAASRGVTHHQGSVQALPWSCLITDDSVKAQTSCVRIVHASFTTGGLGTLQTGKLSTAGRSPNFPHPQLTGRPWLMTSGGMVDSENGPLFTDRPLNPLSINVQKKGGGFAQKTQQKPTGFFGGFSC